MNKPREMVHVHFVAVDICVPNQLSAKEAYARLCKVLSDADFEYITSEYYLEYPDDRPESQTRSTEELFPSQLEPEVCDECGAPVTAGFGVSAEHADACSLHPKNVVSGPIHFQPDE